MVLHTFCSSLPASTTRGREMEGRGERREEREKGEEKGERRGRGEIKKAKEE